LDRAGKIGFVAKAVVYATIGILALQAALGDGGALIDVHDAPDQVRRQPFGDILLVLLGVGLAGYAFWQLGRAAFDRDGGADKGAKRIALRLGWAGSGVFHASLAVGVFQTYLGHRRGHGHSWIHTVLSHDGGTAVLIGVGLGFIGFGGYQLYSAYTAKFRKKLDTWQMSGTEKKWAVAVGRFGFAARGVVLPIVGVLFIQAGWHARASEARGTAGALREIAHQPWGTVLLAVVAAGFIAYALFMLVSARYRRELA
jgi:hypothetical protein